MRKHALVTLALMAAACNGEPTAPIVTAHTVMLQAISTTNYWTIAPTWNDALRPEDYAIEREQGRIVAENNGPGGYLLAWTVMDFPAGALPDGARVVDATLVLRSELVAFADGVGEVRFLSAGSIIGELAFPGLRPDAVYEIPLRWSAVDITIEARSSFDLDGKAPTRRNYLRYSTPSLRITYELGNG